MKAQNAMLAGYTKIIPFLERNAVYSILLFAFILRFSGLYFGLPDLHDPDEPFIINPVQHILATGDMNPHWFVFPGSFIIYLLVFLMVLLWGAGFVYYFSTGQIHHWGEFRALMSLNTVLPYYAGRLFMVLFAIISIYLAYLIAEKLFNKRVGLLASFCLSIAPLYVYPSRIIRPDITESMLILFSYYFLFLFLEENGKSKYLIGASLSAGFAVATKYPAGVIAFPILIYCLMIDLKGSGVSLSKYLMDCFRIKTFFSKALLCMVAGFFVFAPFVILDYHHSIWNIRWETTHQSFAWPERLPGMQNDIWYIQNSLIHGIGGLFFAIFSCLGLCVLLSKRNFRGILFLFFPIVYYIVMVDLGRLRFERWLIPVLPFEAILFGLGFFTFNKYFENKRFPLQNVIWLVLGLFIYISLAVIKDNINYSLLISRPSVQIIANDWVENNFPRDQQQVILARLNEGQNILALTELRRQGLLLNLSTDDLKAAINFYSSAAGKKFLKDYAPYQFQTMRNVSSIMRQEANKEMTQ